MTLGSTKVAPVLSVALALPTRLPISRTIEWGKIKESLIFKS